jgi:ABC-type glutathione transport system ATPase component
MTALLDVRGLQVSFAGQAVVRDLDFTLEAGQTLALVGESGCGKSSTANTPRSKGSCCSRAASCSASRKST